MIGKKKLWGSLRQSFIDMKKDIETEPAKVFLLFCFLIIGLSNYPFEFSKYTAPVVSGFHQILSMVMVFLFALTIKKRMSEINRIRDRVDAALGSPFVWIPILGLLFAGALFLRFYHLGTLDPYTDEIHHLVAARNLHKGEAVTYTRALPITYLVSWIYDVVSPDSYKTYLIWGRVPGAVFGSLTILPLFILSRRISNSVGILACVLWSVSPWSIAVSRYLREYAYYPFITLFAVLAAVIFFERLQEGINRHVGKLLILAGFLLFIVIYSVFLDRLSTLKITLLLFGFMAAWYAVQIAIRFFPTWSTGKKLGYCSAIAAVCGVGLLAVRFTDTSALGLDVDWSFINAFFNLDGSTPTMWWSGYSLYTSMIPLIVIFGFIVSYHRSNKNYFLLFALLIGLLMFYYLFFNRYFKPRYCFYVLPFFTIIFAAGLASLFSFAASFRGIFAKVLAVAIVVLFALPLFQVENVTAAVGKDLINPVIKRKSENRHLKVKRTGVFRTTGEYHQDLKSAIRYLKARIEPDDIFITTIFQAVLVLEFDIDEDRILHYTYPDELGATLVKEAVQEHPKGWLILDYRRHGHFTPLYFSTTENNYIYNIELSPVYTKNEIQIFRWNSE